MFQTDFSNLRAEFSANAENSAPSQNVNACDFMRMQMAVRVQFTQVRHLRKTMTLRIEKDSTGDGTTIRLIGRMRGEHLEELKAQMKDSGPKVALDLNELSLVDVDVVCFLGICQREGVELLHCSPYISEWIARERKT
jgi:glutathione S-transferase